jgi:hypothetical protein
MLAVSEVVPNPPACETSIATIGVTAPGAPSSSRQTPMRSSVRREPKESASARSRLYHFVAGLTRG